MDRWLLGYASAELSLCCAMLALLDWHDLCLTAV